MVIRPKEPGVMAEGYIGIPEKTLTPHRNHWFHTCDIGWVDDEGLFYFTCGIVERSRVKGEMVFSFGVEEGALSHLEIEEAAVIGIPSEMGEEDIRLFVTLKPSSSFTEDTIRTHFQAVMARFMALKVISTLNGILHTTTGKPEKGKLQ